MVQDDAPVGLDGVQVEFDDERLVSDAGLDARSDACGAVGDRGAGAAFRAAAAEAAGGGQRGPQGDVADLRDGAWRRQHRRLRRAARGPHAPAAWRLGCGAVDVGDVSARVHVRARAPARPAARRGAHARVEPGAGPGGRAPVVDVDSFIGEVHGHAKQGAAFGYTRKRGYHPIIATPGANR